MSRNAAVQYILFSRPAKTVHLFSFNVFASEAKLVARFLFWIFSRILYMVGRSEINLYDVAWCESFSGFCSNKIWAVFHRLRKYFSI